MPDALPIHGDTMIVDMIRKFAQERLAPLAAEREKKRLIEPEIVRELGELGVFGATTPAEWDGSEIDPVTYAMLLEEIAAGDGSVSTMVSVHNSPTCIVVANNGTNAQKDRWLRKLATGSMWARSPDRAAGWLRCLEFEDASGEERRQVHRQWIETVHQQRHASRQSGVLRGDRSIGRQARDFLFRHR